MQKYKLRFIKSELVAKDTKSFYFKKPADFIYQAGQYLRWTLINPIETDAEGNSRFFSISSAPHEDFLMITTRMRDTAFKRTLGKFVVDQEIEAFGPMGKFILPEDASKPVVFISGGIGITPFYSMVKEATHQKSQQKIYLFFFNHNPEETPFLNELTDLAKLNPNFIFIPVMTRVIGNIWQGETGHVNKPLLIKYIGNISTPTFYSAGPPAMVESLQKSLIESSVTQEQIKTETFSGY